MAIRASKWLQPVISKNNILIWLKLFTRICKDITLHLKKFKPPSFDSFFIIVHRKQQRCSPSIHQGIWIACGCRQDTPIALIFAPFDSAQNSTSDRPIECQSLSKTSSGTIQVRLSESHICRFELQKALYRKNLFFVIFEICNTHSQRQYASFKKVIAKGNRPIFYNLHLKPSVSVCRFSQN